MKRYQTTLYKLFVGGQEYNITPTREHKKDFRITLKEIAYFPEINEQVTTFYKFEFMSDLELYFEKHPAKDNCRRFLM